MFLHIAAKVGDRSLTSLCGSRTICRCRVERWSVCEDNEAILGSGYRNIHQKSAVSVSEQGSVGFEVLYQTECNHWSLGPLQLVDCANGHFFKDFGTKEVSQLAFEVSPGQAGLGGKWRDHGQHFVERTLVSRRQVGMGVGDPAHHFSQLGLVFPGRSFLLRCGGIDGHPRHGGQACRCRRVWSHSSDAAAVHQRIAVTNDRGMASVVIKKCDARHGLTIGDRGSALRHSHARASGRAKLKWKVFRRYPLLLGQGFRPFDGNGCDGLELLGVPNKNRSPSKCQGAYSDFRSALTRLIHDQQVGSELFAQSAQLVCRRHDHDPKHHQPANPVFAAV